MAQDFPIHCIRLFKHSSFFFASPLDVVNLEHSPVGSCASDTLSAHFSDNCEAQFSLPFPRVDLRLSISIMLMLFSARSGSRVDFFLVVVIILLRVATDFLLVFGSPLLVCFQFLLLISHIVFSVSHYQFLQARKSQRAVLHSWAFAQLGAFLKYKSVLAGIPLVEVDPRNSSRECSQCGHTEKLNRPSQSQFRCKSCGYETNADYNAARVLSSRASVNRPIAA